MKCTVDFKLMLQLILSRWRARRETDGLFSPIPSVFVLSVRTVLA